MVSGDYGRASGKIWLGAGSACVAYSLGELHWLRSSGSTPTSTPMKLIVTRKTFTTQSTIGELSVDGAFECFTLEDPVRPKRIPAVTAIPAGTYGVEITFSPKFGTDLPLLLDVPECEGVRIHPGNSAADSGGCLLVGKSKAIDFIGSSRDAFRGVLSKIAAAQKGGESITIQIVDAGTSPFMASAEGDLEVTSINGTRLRAMADPLRLRSSADTAKSVNSVGRLPFGHFVVQTARSGVTGWIKVATEFEGTKLRGFVAKRFLESVPGAAAPTKPGARAVELFRVKSPTLTLREEPAKMDDALIVAGLPQSLLVAKVAASRKPLWWEVETLLNGKKLRGFVHSGLLEPDSGPESISVEARFSSTSGEVQAPERALELIFKFEGFDQPSAWPGGGSGVTLGIGYDLGFHTRDEFFSDWGPHLSPGFMTRLVKALGKTGAAAKKLARSFTDIKIPRKAGEAVFIARTVPKQVGLTGRAFPGVTKLPPDAQGALVSLVFNRGTSMQGHRRREMREIRDAIARTDFKMSKLLEAIATSIESMIRLWIGKGLDGLIRRRKAEAALVRSCI